MNSSKIRLRKHVGKHDRQVVIDVRIGFISQETTLNAWCEANDINYGNANKALLGTWKGKKGKALKSKIIEAAKVKKTRKQ